MAPINLPDGTEVSEVILPDGSTASEVIAPDGSAVFSAIPDSVVNNTVHLFDARSLSLSDGDTVSTWQDEVGTADLSVGSGTPKYVANAINGAPAVAYDGVDDRHDATFGSSISDPYSVFFSGRLRSRNTGSAQTAWGVNPVPGSGFVGFQTDNGSGGYGWKINGDSDQRLGTNDTTAHIFSNLFNSGNGSLREDSSALATANADSDVNAFGGISLGRRSDGFGPADILITEVLVYSVNESSTQTDIENYLDRDLGLI